MLAANIMILSFTILELFNLNDIPHAAFCSIGLFIYILCAEYVSVKNIKQRLYDMEAIRQEVQQGNNANPRNVSPSDAPLSDTPKPPKKKLAGTVQKVFDIMVTDNQANAKSIASALDIQVNTAKSYISQIYAGLGVHSRAEFNSIISANEQNKE